MTPTSAPANVVLGAGPIGSTIARQLAEAGEAVRLVTRTGRDIGVNGVTSLGADMTDQAAVRSATEVARTVYFAAAPAYNNWPKGFPPLVEGVLGGLKSSGIRLAVVDNLYAYGPPHGAPIGEDLPYAATNRKGAARAWVAEQFMAAHAAGDVQVTIARASDYFGPGAVDSAVGERFFGPIIAGKAASVFGDPDAPHSVTYVPDFARALIELARHDEAFGEVWHVPSVPRSRSVSSPAWWAPLRERERPSFHACPARCCFSPAYSFPRRERRLRCSTSSRSHSFSTVPKWSGLSAWPRPRSNNQSPRRWPGGSLAGTQPP
jgi:nucleoside-diphosphate-sugar epimerase